MKSSDKQETRDIDESLMQRVQKAIEIMKEIEHEIPERKTIVIDD